MAYKYEGRVPLAATTRLFSASRPTMAKRNHEQLSQDDMCMRFVITPDQSVALMSDEALSLKKIASESSTRLRLSAFKSHDVGRVLYLTGSAENIARAIGALARLWSHEDGSPSSSRSKTLTLRIMVAECLIGKVVGPKGAMLTTIQRKSGAKIEAKKNTLGESTDREVIARGVADALHRAVYFVGEIFSENRAILARMEKAMKEYVPSCLRGDAQVTTEESRVGPSASRESQKVTRIMSQTGQQTSSPTTKKPRRGSSGDIRANQEAESRDGSSSPPPPPPPPPPPVEKRLHNQEGLRDSETRRKDKSATKEKGIDSARTPKAAPIAVSDDDSHIVEAPPSPPADQYAAVTKRLMVASPMIGVVLSFSDELLNIMRQSSGAAIRVREIVNNDQAILLVTGTKSQVSRVMDDLTLTTRNSYLVTQAMSLPEYSTSETVEKLHQKNPDFLGERNDCVGVSVKSEQVVKTKNSAKSLKTRLQPNHHSIKSIQASLSRP